MSSFSYLIVAIYLVIGLIGGLYAYIIYLKPWEKTYWEVVVGGLIIILGVAALQWVTYLHYGCIPLWAAILHTPGAFAATGISQIILQDWKHKEGYKRVKVKLVNHDNEEIQEE